MAWAIWKDSRIRLPIKLVPSFAFVALLGTGCSSDTANIGPRSCTTLADGAFTAQQRSIADQIISVFENDTPTLQYGYAEDIKDGRGITAGRAGFTTATRDLLVVVERYTLRVPGNPLARYLPRLRELADSGSASTAGLDGLIAAWATAARDRTFRNVQDEVVDEQYYLPAVEQARALGLTCPISLLVIYDTNIQHGSGDDPDGLPAIVARTKTSAEGSPASGVDEHRWTEKFLDVRRSVLLDPANKATKDAWAASVTRVDTLRSIAAAGNYALAAPITISPNGTQFAIR